MSYFEYYFYGSSLEKDVKEPIKHLLYKDEDCNFSVWTVFEIWNDWGMSSDKSFENCQNYALVIDFLYSFLALLKNNKIEDKLKNLYMQSAKA